MPFVKSASTVAADDVQRLINLGLVYSLTLKSNGQAVSHHHTLEDARRAKTRKTRVVLTRKLLLIDRDLQQWQEQKHST